MKILITAPTFLPSLEGPQFADAPSFADAAPETAHAIVRAGKAQYVNKADDPSKLKQFTASDVFVAQLEQAIADEAKAASGKAKAPKAEQAAITPAA